MRGGEFMKTARTLIKTLGSVTAVFALAFLVAAPASADLLKGAKVEPSDTTPSQAATTHLYSFTIGTSDTLKSIDITYCTTPSGACTAPAGMTVASSTLSGETGITAADWTLASATANTLLLDDSTDAGFAATADTSVVTFTIGAVTNHAVGDCNASSNNSSDTCYVRIETNDAVADGGTDIDNVIASVTVVADVTVTATVDPSFTFVVGSVGASTVNNAITTSVASTYSTLPFGNLTAATPKYAAHSLTVTTNANNGYSIYSEMATAMTGLYASNNIDPFAAAWGTSTTWTQPTGTGANVNTGWIGANITDLDVTSGPTTAQYFGAISGTAALVSRDTDSDDGTTPSYVTYGIEVNFYQPADQYTGTLQYTALPSY